MWQGKGEATKGSEGLKKFVLKPGRLGEAIPVKISLVEGFAGFFFKDFQGRILVFDSCAPDFDVYQPPAVWVYPAKLWMKLDSESEKTLSGYG